MDTSAPPNPYTQHRFPAEIISHAVWLSVRCCLRYRDGEALLRARGILVPYEAIRTWGPQFGQAYAHQVRRRRPKPGDTWHLEEVVRTIKGARHDLWRAVEHDGPVLDMLVQSRRHQTAAKRGFRKRRNGCQSVPRVSITDTRASEGAATRALRPSVEQRQHRYLNHRAENAHQPPRPRARRLVRFKSPGQAQRFLSAYGPIVPHVRPRRHRLSAPEYRHEMRQRCQMWGEITGTIMAASRPSAVQPSHLSASSWHQRESVDNAKNDDEPGCFGEV